MNISIAVVDTDIVYLEKLVEVLQEYDDLSVSMYTSAEKLQRALQTKSYDIVLFDADVSEHKLMFFHVTLPICLYSDEAKNRSLYADCAKVIKYQRISMIYKEMLKMYADTAGYRADFSKEQTAKILAVYSPIGGSGKTTVALALASRLSAKGKRVLFLSMEQMDSSAYLNPHTEETDGITSLLEGMNENSNLELKLKGILKIGLNGMAYVEGFERIVDINAVSQEEMELILEQIKAHANADVIVIDMESRLDAVGCAIFEKADRIVVIERQGELASYKLDRFAQQAVVLEHSKKMVKLCNFADGVFKENHNLQLKNIGFIGDCGNQSVKTILQIMTTKANIQDDII